jgi:hypothetical protein
MTATFACASCGYSQLSDPKAIGQSFSCPRCGSIAQVVAGNAAPAGPPAAPPVPASAQRQSASGDRSPAPAARTGEPGASDASRPQASKNNASAPPEQQAPRKNERAASEPARPQAPENRESCRRKQMSAKMQGLLGAILGCAVFFLIFHYKGGPPSRQEAFAVLPAFAVFGFGYAFSLDILKRWLTKVAGVSGDIVFWSVLSQLVWRRGIFFGLFLIFFLFACAVGLAYLPGIVTGIKRIAQEGRAGS